ncbi:MAG: GIY-YIG nuclease family protein [Chroococcidiopsidaceae cyanobacterium CP_BM_ER_R8_30]|nr:GIY-YIG nuclease family protein [Chroococcidiopsidaceae cyanobacterium CP_BM_ER_R8_30]
MVRRNKETVFIVRDLNNPLKGWGWVDLDIEVIKRFGLSTQRPQGIVIDSREHKALLAEGKRYTQCINPPNRGTSGTKKFVVNNNGELINLSVQKTLTIEAVCAWVKTWASHDAKIITPGKKTISLAGEAISGSSAFIYFVLNADSNAIKIGMAKDLDQRLKSLQTSSPARLQLIKVVQLANVKEAAECETKLHRKFAHLRLSGEWFKAEKELFDHIENSEIEIQ